MHHTVSQLSQIISKHKEMIEITLFIYLSESEFEHLFLDFVSVSVITNIY